jgi:hypothetical protein
MAVSGNTRLLSALEANWQAEMEGFRTHAALSEREAEAFVEGYQLGEPLQRPSSPQQHRRSTTRTSKTENSVVTKDTR